MLIRVAEGWVFDSEQALEDLVLSNLSSLFPVKSIGRQFVCKGEICDIIAVGSQQELVIFELKNSEDRYLVQQLTRYYDNLIDEKPLNERISYEQPVKLIGIAPSFHRHNLIDQKYLKLELELFSFIVKKDNDGIFWLSLHSLNQQEIGRVKIPYEEINLKSIDLPSPPQWFVDILGGMPPLARKHILSIREKILNFDSRIKEVVGQNTILYGLPTKGRKCAEFIFDRKSKQFILFLWLPFQERDSGLVAGRHRVWTDWYEVTHLASVGEGLGDKKTQEEWLEYHRQKDISQGKPTRDGFCAIGEDTLGRKRILGSSGPSSKKTANNISRYAGRMGYPGEDTRLMTIVDMALQMWWQKIE